MRSGCPKNQWSLLSDTLKAILTTKLNYRLWPNAQAKWNFLASLSATRCFSRFSKVSRSFHWTVFRNMRDTEFRPHGKWLPRVPGHCQEHKHPWGCMAQTPQLARFVQSVGAYRGRIYPKSIPSRVVSNAELAINTFLLKGINKWMNVWSVECGNVDILFKRRPAVIHLENIRQWPVWRQRIWIWFICHFFLTFDCFVRNPPNRCLRLWGNVLETVEHPLHSELQKP